MSSGITAFAAGCFHSLAVQNGALYAWGFNGDGELGNGTHTKSNRPVAVTGMSSGVTAAAAGLSHSLAVRSGNVYAWGYNRLGQLGDGTTTEQNTPEEIDPADLHNIKAIATGFESSYALSFDGSLWVWGRNIDGELGLGTSAEDYLTPQHLLPPSGYIFTSISANSDGGSALATLAPTPEPASLSLLALGGLALLRRRSGQVLKRRR